MDKKKVADLAQSFSLSCKELVKDKHLMRTLTSPTVVLVALTLMNIVSPDQSRRGWA
jgi:hypothetical protein